MAIREFISLLMAIILIISLIFVSGCTNNPGLEDVFSPENLENAEINPPNEVLIDPTPSDDFDIEKFFPKE